MVALHSRVCVAGDAAKGCLHLLITSAVDTRYIILCKQCIRSNYKINIAQNSIACKQCINYSRMY